MLGVLDIQKRQFPAGCFGPAAVNIAELSAPAQTMLLLQYDSPICVPYDTVLFLRTLEFAMKHPFGLRLVTALLSLI